ncbi:MAG: right-handed parallel beta-helix repeat-containing protein [Kiritimatiellaeota bacterium]|nr:right-handed parallel beta-helix repeat-containing protein [Kiritimatiellota bacterium]
MQHRKLWIVLVLATGNFACLAAPGAERLTLYVSTRGNDAWSGRLPDPNEARTDGPLATVFAARDAVRRLRRARRTGTPAVVLLRGGTYALERTFVLTPRDSFVTYAAFPGEKPVLSGGRVVGGWSSADGRVWHARVPEVVRDNWTFRQLFVNGKRRTRARSPNRGWFAIAGKAPPRPGSKDGGKTPRDRIAFKFRPGDIQPWPHLNEINVVVYHSWETSRLRIASVDSSRSTVEFTGPAAWPFLRWGPGQRYYVENFRAALDAPGEWYLDRRTGVVMYYPLPGEDMRTAQVVAPRLTRLVSLEGDAELGMWVERVVFRGLAFRYEDWELEPEGHSDHQAVSTAPAAIMADGVRECVIENCEIAHVGHYGLWFRQACKSNRIVHNRIHDMGIGGVRIGVTRGLRSEMFASSANVLDNNHIFDGGHVYAGGVGVWVAQSHHNIISHNEIHDFNYSGMSIGWTWNDAPNACHDNIIEYNHVHHVMNRQLNDGGAIYTLGTSPGSVIRNNVFHDIWPYSGIGWGIYLDATTNQYLVEDNVVYNSLSGGLMKHNGGHENVIRNNVFAFSAEQMLWPCWSPKPNRFERNIVYFTQGDLFIPMAERRLRARRAAGESLGIWDYNIYWNPNKPNIRFFRHTFPKWQALGLDRHSVVADPLFVDAAGYDFRLRPGSPALRLGFKPIDVSRVGLYGEREWVAEATRISHSPTKLPPPPLPPKPVPVDDGFEEAPVGASPPGATVSGEEKGASIRVTDEQAASGRHSLKFIDAAGLKNAWQPHMFYRPRFRQGRVRESFDILLETGALVFTEWRDSGPYPENIGPSVTFDARAGDRATVSVGHTPVGVAPLKTWVHVEIECALDERAPGPFTLRLTVPGAPPRIFRGIHPAGKEFRELQWLGFVSNATTRAVFYIDNVKVRRMTGERER